jgi:hypothetical protein
MRLVSYRRDENDGEPPLFLADGDVVEVEIGGIATRRNPGSSRRPPRASRGRR